MILLLYFVALFVFVACIVSVCELNLSNVHNRVRTPGHVPKKTHRVFLGKPTLKNPAKKNPVQNNQILMSNSTVIKKIFSRLKDVNV